jgi:hypothetical protein
MIHSYSKIYNLGHKELESLFTGPVLIEEKCDGSQFSFTKSLEGTLTFRSRGREIPLPCDDKLFKSGIDYIHSISDVLNFGWTYRGEILAKPKHNTLAYSRVPRHNIIIFDIDMGMENYTLYNTKLEEAKKLDLEVVPCLYYGEVKDVLQLKDLLNRESCLGGTKIEGMVIKNYTQFGRDKKTLMGKWVSEAFKEKHTTEWKKNNPGQNDLISNIVAIYKHENRWEKAVQHLKEIGKLEYDPRDIGSLIKEVQQDVLAECADEIKEKIWKYAWPKIGRGITRGLPEWWKIKLAEYQFDKEVL